MPTAGMQVGVGWNFQAALNRILIRHWRQDFRTIVEWGPGYSTLTLLTWLSRIPSGTLISVEQNPDYLAKLRNSISPTDTWIPILADVHDSWYRKADREKLRYSSAPLSVTRNADFFLVDGRARAECLLTAAMMGSPNALYLLDDSARMRYRYALHLFETIDTELRFRIMRRKNSFTELSMQFQQQLSEGFKKAPILVPPEGDDRARKNMTWAPPVDEIVGLELDSFHSALSFLREKRTGEALIFGPANLARELKRSSRFSCWKSVTVVDNQSTQNKKSNLIRSVTGNLNDRSMDPSSHYSSATADLGEFDLYIVAGHRRNECLLSIAQSAPRGAQILTRHGSDLHCRIGLALLSQVRQFGDWILSESH